ncbi:MAG: nucleotidyltransferase substrate binding protein [Paludibacteraceae bacterium]|jgi:nucleotidyltransferase substrate binding protein (TIGR01987 family)|nr:nucleotidyltransferase substrate binding protein [Paludibacteraceae bacterium]
MENTDIRWVQRYSNFRKALAKMSEAIDIVAENYDWQDSIDELLKEGLIQRFEYTHELAWKVMKDYEEYQGYNNIRGSRDAIRLALQIGIIEDKEWLETIEDRNLTSHNYDEEVAEDVFISIVNDYYPLLVKFDETMLIISKNI